MNMRILRDFDNDHRAFYAYLYVELVNGLSDAHGTIPSKRRGMARSSIREGGVAETAVRSTESILSGYFKILHSRVDAGRLVDDSGVERSISHGTAQSVRRSSVSMGDGGRSVADGIVVARQDADTTTSSIGPGDSSDESESTDYGRSGRLGRVDGDVTEGELSSATAVSQCVSCERGPNWERNDASRKRAKSKTKVKSSVNEKLQNSWDERRIAENMVAAAQAQKKLEAIVADQTSELKELRQSLAKAKAEKELRMAESNADLEVEADRLRRELAISKTRTKLEGSPDVELKNLREQFAMLEAANIHLKADLRKAQQTQITSKELIALQEGKKNAEYRLVGTERRYNEAIEQSDRMERLKKEADKTIRELREQLQVATAIAK